jgi:hypothetical protein
LQAYLNEERGTPINRSRSDSHRDWNLPRPALDLHQAEQQVLDRDLLVLHPVGLGLRRVEDTVELGHESRVSATDFRQGVQPLLGRTLNLHRVGPQLTQQRPDDRLIRVE